MYKMNSYLHVLTSNSAIFHFNSSFLNKLQEKKGDSIGHNTAHSHNTSKYSKGIGCDGLHCFIWFSKPFADPLGVKHFECLYTL